MRRTIIIATLLLFSCIAAQAQMVGATNNQNPQREQRVDNSPFYHPAGGAFRFEGGFPHLFSVAYVYHLNSHIMFGAGTGVGLSGYTREYRYYYKPANSYTYKLYDIRGPERDYDALSMPLFVEIDLHTPRYKWSLFLNVKAGYNLFRPEDESKSYGFLQNIDYDSYDYRLSDHAYKYYYTYDRFFFDASVGFSYKNVSLGGGCSTVYYFNAFLSYNLPIKTIKRLLY